MTSLTGDPDLTGARQSIFLAAMTALGGHLSTFGTAIGDS
jgi:hypothetical protein